MSAAVRTVTSTHAAAAGPYVRHHAASPMAPDPRRPYQRWPIVVGVGPVAVCVCVRQPGGPAGRSPPPLSVYPGSSEHRSTASARPWVPPTRRRRRHCHRAGRSRQSRTPAALLRTVNDAGRSTEYIWEGWSARRLPRKLHVT